MCFLDRHDSQLVVNFNRSPWILLLCGVRVSFMHKVRCRHKTCELFVSQCLKTAALWMLTAPLRMLLKLPSLMILTTKYHYPRSHLLPSHPLPLHLQRTPFPFCSRLDVPQQQLQLDLGALAGPQNCQLVFAMLTMPVVCLRQLTQGNMLYLALWII